MSKWPSQDKSPQQEEIKQRHQPTLTTNRMVVRLPREVDLEVEEVVEEEEEAEVVLVAEDSPEEEDVEVIEDASTTAKKELKKPTITITNNSPLREVLLEDEAEEDKVKIKAKPKAKILELSPRQLCSLPTCPSPWTTPPLPKFSLTTD